MEFQDFDFAEISGRNWFSVCLKTIYLCYVMLKEARKRIKYNIDGTPFPKGKGPWDSKRLLVYMCLRLVEKE